MRRGGEFTFVILCAIVAVAMVVVGVQFYQQTWGEDAPVHRALGPEGIPVMAMLTDRSKTYPIITTVQYSVHGRHLEQMILQDDAVTRAPLGHEMAFRVDPRNYNFIIRADARKPWTWWKMAGCALVVILGLVFGFVLVVLVLNRFRF